MGRQIIQQPDGLYAVWSSIVDSFILIDATPEDIVAFFVNEETRRIQAEVSRIVAALGKGEKPYYQFTKTWAEACQWHEIVHGKPFSLEEARQEEEAVERGGVVGT